MAGAVTAVDAVKAHCASCQEQGSRMRNYLVQKSRSAVETSGAFFGNKIQNEVVILFWVASWFIRSDCIGMVNGSVTALLQSTCAAIINCVLESSD
jgi:hypothetical protein